MKKLMTILLFVVTVLSIKAQNSYLLTETGEKVTIMGDLKLDFDNVSFKIENKEKKKGFEYVGYKDKKIKMIEFVGRVFMVLPDKKNIYLQEIVCFNDKYILTSQFRGGSDYFIKVFDWNFNSICNLKQLFAGKKFQKNDIEDRIKPYFGDCSNVTDLMAKNIQDQKNQIIEDVYAVKCNSTTKSIQDLIKAFLALPVKQ
ncbi:MAG TPA: hypothetical protein VN026_18400 [Bacteroidia bacterium]|jgi:hypothetical protein|nr:hypothetical protein [Bacteroidia bacterium]